MAEPVLRRAEESDREMIFGWRNDPWIVGLSTSRRTVTRAEHDDWFGRVVADPGTILFVVETGGTPAGQVRLTMDGEAGGVEAVISIYLLKEHTGRGIGAAAIGQGCAAAFAQWPGLRRVRAQILRDNEPSMRAFEKAGFVPADGDGEFHYMTKERA